MQRNRKRRTVAFNIAMSFHNFTRLFWIKRLILISEWINIYQYRLKIIDSPLNSNTSFCNIINFIYDIDDFFSVGLVIDVQMYCNKCLNVSVSLFCTSFANYFTLFFSTSYSREVIRLSNLCTCSFKLKNQMLSKQNNE